jgi:hypothetical protein
MRLTSGATLIYVFGHEQMVSNSFPQRMVSVFVGRNALSVHKQWRSLQLRHGVGHVSPFCNGSNSADHVRMDAPAGMMDV